MGTRVTRVALAVVAVSAVALAGETVHPGETRSYDEAIPIDTVAEFTANASIGDVNADGHLDIVLAKGRHCPLPDVVLLGNGKGQFKPGPKLPNKPDRSYSAPLADLDGDGDLDIVLSNDAPDAKLILLNDGTGRFTSGGTFGMPEWSTRNVVVADLNGDRAPEIVVAKSTRSELDLRQRWQGAFQMPPARSRDVDDDSRRRHER